MSRKRSRSRLIVLFVVALVAGVLLRLWLLPPTISLTAVEVKFLGAWDVVNQTDQSSLLWRFDRERKVVVLQKDADATYRELWTGRWQVRDKEMELSNITAVQGLSMRPTANYTIQFADTPDMVSWKDVNGVQFRASKSR